MDSPEHNGHGPALSPPRRDDQRFDRAEDAVEALIERYREHTHFISEAFRRFAAGDDVGASRFRAWYPEVRVSISSYAQVDTRLSYGHVPEPGVYASTITRPDLFRSYLVDQLGLVIRNYKVDVTVGQSTTPIPLHFAFGDDAHIRADNETVREVPLRDLFDVPELATIDDHIVNGTHTPAAGVPLPLAPFTAQRVDYSLARLAHYTATRPEHFQNFVLFTNYQFYVDGFCAFAEACMADPDAGYAAFVAPGNVITRAGTPDDAEGTPPPRPPQMPAYHLVKPDGQGITLVNIGVGPSNAKTITDHIGVLRPDAWLMLGHCAGLRKTQRLGDYVLAHAYVREDHVLDTDLPASVPVPALAETQVALEEAVAEITGLTGFELKRIMRTGTVATIADRNWELRDQSDPVRRLSQSRAIALDMESATIAANGFRFRVPYGTLLCVSDKPLHGELKLPGMASDFYRRQVDQHLRIGILTLQKLSRMPLERLHSRKLRSFTETAFK
ncbi:MAG: AMP nucleosidase [Pseudomonadota bacterium]